MTSPCERLFLGGVGNDDAALGLLFGVDAADDHAVVQGTKLGLGHGFLVGASAHAVVLESVDFSSP